MASAVVLKVSLIHDFWCKVVRTQKARYAAAAKASGLAAILNLPDDSKGRGLTPRPLLGNRIWTWGTKPEMRWCADAKDVCYRA